MPFFHNYLFAILPPIIYGGLMRFLVLSLLILLTACHSKPTIKSIANKSDSEPILRVASGEPESLDPRLIRTTNGVTAVGLFYEGLLRHDYMGRVVNGVADEAVVSEDGKTWTIRLREAHWSNGDRITSNDFRDTWLSTLAPGFPAPNSYQMYVIQGAQEYKDGTNAKDSVGILAPDPQTLVIKLKEPVPFFGELLASPFFYPVHSSQRSGNVPKNTIISNGPFQLEKWAHNNSILAKKNPVYWDNHEVKLDEIEIVFVDDTTALNMFKAHELDWAGSPSGNIPSDAVRSLEAERVLEQKPAAATTWFRVNTTRPGLNIKEYRQALYYAIDRKAIADHLLHGKQMPATGIVPTFWLGSPVPLGDSFNPGKAWELFQQALEKMDADRENLKPLIICYKAGERAQKVAQAIQQQWEQTLGIKVNLEQCEGAAILDKWVQLEYDIALGSWLADIEDPVNFLEVFHSKTTPTNNTGWENLMYKELINRSYTETGHKRLQTLSEAQKIITEDAPVIPIFYHTFLFAKQPSVHGVWLSKLGFLDFKYAFIDDTNFEELEPLD